ncbi:zinc-ribbon domain-containing protein [Pseudocolwellia sp. AS88]
MEYPQLLKHLDTTKNKDINIDKLLSTSTTELSWNCVACKDTYKR